MGNCCCIRLKNETSVGHSTVSSVRVPVTSPWISPEERAIATETYYLVDQWISDVKTSNPQIKNIPVHAIDQKQREIDARLRANINWGSSLPNSYDDRYMDRYGRVGYSGLTGDSISSSTSISNWYSSSSI